MLKKEARVAADFRRDSVRFSLVWDVLQDVVSARAAEAGRAALDIVDVGGGTGGLAVPFAALGHNVTVIDPSPDALAAAQRRAAEAGARLTAVQGEAASLDSVVGPKSADLVICHNVLEYVDSPADAMTAIAAVLRPSATVSVLAANTVAAVLHRALAGRFTEARQLLGGEAAEAAEATAAGPRRCAPSRRPQRPLRRCGTSPRSCTCSVTADAAMKDTVMKAALCRNWAARIRTTPAATSCTWTWTRSTRAWRSGNARSSRACRSSWAVPAAAAWCCRLPTRPGRSGSGRRCRSAGRRGCARGRYSSRPSTGCTPRCPRRSWRSSARSRPR